jgi:transposase
LFLLSERQMARTSPYCIVSVIKNGLRWKDTPRRYGPHKTLYNCFIRCSRLGVSGRILAVLASEGQGQAAS